jgi:hypothetical protein
MISDEEYLYVSLRNGSIVSMRFKDKLNATNIHYLQRANREEHYSVMKLSRDNTFLVAYVDIDNLEAFHVFDVIKRKKVWTGTLDLSAGANREDPLKLLVLSDNCLSIFARGENGKGVTMYSLFDGSVI